MLPLDPSCNFYKLNKLYRYERRYGPDSFVSSLSGPLKSTVYNGLESYNPNIYIGKYTILQKKRRKKYKQISESYFY